MAKLDDALFRRRLVCELPLPGAEKTISAVPLKRDSVRFAAFPALTLRRMRLRAVPSYFHPPLAGLKNRNFAGMSLGTSSTYLCTAGPRQGRTGFAVQPPSNGAAELKRYRCSINLCIAGPRPGRATRHSLWLSACNRSSGRSRPLRWRRSYICRAPGFSARVCLAGR